MLTLIAKIKEKQLGLSTDPKSVSELEEMLIRVCAMKNKNLSNVSTAMTAKKLQVEGFTVRAFTSKRGRPEIQHKNRVMAFSKLIRKRIIPLSLD